MNNLPLKPGYKQTEVGVIPEEWEIRRICDIAHVKTGPFGSSLHESDYVKDGTPIITVEHLDEFGVIHSDLPMVSESDKRRLDAYILQSGDIVFSRVGSIDRNTLIRPTEAGWLFSGRLLRVRLNGAKIFAPYLSYHFHGEPFKLRVKIVAVGQTMPSLNTQILNGINVVVPTITEQRAIAAALSDVDALLAKLDQLIAKKRDLKLAVMQQLLTGKTRLPGFDTVGAGLEPAPTVPDGWETKRLGDTVEVIMGQSPASATYNRLGIGSPLLNGPTEFTDKHPIKIQWTSQPIKICKNGDLLLCVRGSSTGRINISDDEYCIGRGIAAIRATFDMDMAFITYQVHSAIQSILSATTGSTFPNIDGKSIRAIEILVPSFDEQTAIASILSDMDAEIAALETRRDKTRDIKQGMMQELLTGRIRLV